MGEIKVDAAIGGRRITMDPIRVIDVPLEIREVESNIPAGFQIEWGTADIDGEELTLCSGAGMGSRWATIRYRGKSYAFTADQLITAFIEALRRADQEAGYTYSCVLDVPDHGVEGHVCEPG